ncbi:enoyl-CoA hydratase/isomerase family protein [Micromonospora inositola]|uniref:Enoyl-CoA hydratase n=1 Tax=Micromonospora inositola TaxID=47865 RepID=A0A1C5K5P2_9ACTN|nr:enoyl-CoA hydratase/isomerase family protein [Micromonospora inositola]SCG77921.1 enoyl-CoA hydratase [Micromonospora inositola]
MISVSLEDHVAWVVLDRPERANALVVEDWRLLTSAVEDAGASPQTRALVIRGAGSRHFSAGMDLDELGRAFEDADAADALCAAVTGALAAITFCPKPTVAMVNGAAVGGGAEIVLASDVRIAAANASFGLPMSRVGVAIDSGSLHNLLASVGRGPPARLLFTGDRLTAREAAAAGLFHEVVAGEELQPAVARLTGRIAAGDADTVLAMKRMILDAAPPPRPDLWATQMRASFDRRARSRT